MKAAFISAYGSPDQITTGELPIPEINSDEILIKVHATSVNPVDWKIASGSMRRFLKIQFPYIPGADVSGVVEKTGSEVSKFKKGDEVFAFLDIVKAGACAQFVACKESLVAFKPRHITHEEASTIPLAGVTAIQALGKRKQDIKANDHYLILGSAGGVGILALQIVKAHGAFVTSVVSGSGMHLCNRLGADDTIDYTKTDIRKIESRFDFIFDTTGKYNYFNLSHLLKKKGGVFVTTLPSFTTILAMILLSMLRIFRYKKKVSIVMAKPYLPDLEYAGRLILSHKLNAVIDKMYSLSEIKEAWSHSIKGSVKGKIVVKIQ